MPPNATWTPPDRLVNLTRKWILRAAIRAQVNPDWAGIATTRDSGRSSDVHWSPGVAPRMLTAMTMTEQSTDIWAQSTQAVTGPFGVLTDAPHSDLTGDSTEEVVAAADAPVSG